jgi:hypothetical protein
MHGNLEEEKNSILGKLFCKNSFQNSLSWHEEREAICLVWRPTSSWGF